jgi:hypothetical protein
LAPQPPTPRLARATLVELLSASLGIDVATNAVREIATQLGFGQSAAFDRPETLAVLEGLSQRPGLVGVVARFVKVRVILSQKW